MSSAICFFCGASPDQPLEDAIRALKSCNNCRVDIQLKGKWSGHGWSIVCALGKKYGWQKTEDAWFAAGP